MSYSTALSKYDLNTATLSASLLLMSSLVALLMPLSAEATFIQWEQVPPLSTNVFRVAVVANDGVTSVNDISEGQPAALSAIGDIEGVLSPSVVMNQYSLGFDSTTLSFSLGTQAIPASVTLSGAWTWAPDRAAPLGTTTQIGLVPAGVDITGTLSTFDGEVFPFAFSLSDYDVNDLSAFADLGVSSDGFTLSAEALLLNFASSITKPVGSSGGITYSVRLLQPLQYNAATLQGTVVPEPSTALLVIVGLAGLSLQRRRG